MRKNRFRYSMYSELEFSEICEKISYCVKNIYQNLCEKNISNSEFIAGYLIAIQIVAKSNLAIGPQFKTPLADQPLKINLNFKVSNIISWLPNHIKISQRVHELETINPIEIFNKYSLTSIPQSANHALIMYNLNKYPLELQFSAPEPTEVMNLQAEGRRLVTVFASPNAACNTFYDGRDPFSFAIHDLIHADLFYRDPQVHIQQVAFFKFLKRFICKKPVEELLKADFNFAKKINYLASDMNSHPMHLTSYLKHTLSEHNLEHTLLDG